MAYSFQAYRFFFFYLLIHVFAERYSPWSYARTSLLFIQGGTFNSSVLFTVRAVTFIFIPNQWNNSVIKVLLYKKDTKKKQDNSESKGTIAQWVSTTHLEGPCISTSCMFCCMIELRRIFLLEALCGIRGKVEFHCICFWSMTLKLKEVVYLITLQQFCSLNICLNHL